MKSYLSKRKIKSNHYPFFRCIIPKDLQGNFGGITDFRLSLSYVRNEDTQILCLKLKKKLDYLSKQISTVGGIALVACSLSGEGLLSKGVIFTSLFSSNEPEFDDLDTLFEDEI